MTEYTRVLVKPVAEMSGEQVVDAVTSKVEVAGVVSARVRRGGALLEFDSAEAAERGL